MLFKSARFITSATAPGGYPKHQLPEVALAGRSNVGKSSLVNALAQGKGVARVAKQPGRTQTINFYRMEDVVVLVDLPGYGFAKVPESVRRTWGPMIERYLGGRPQLAAVILLVDARHGPTADDRMMWEWVQKTSLSRLVVATKWDKLSKNERPTRRKAIESALGQACLPFSAKTGEGRDALIAFLKKFSRKSS